MHAGWNLRRSCSRSLALALLLLVASPLFAQQLTVVAAKGEVKLQFDNYWQTPYVGMIVTLPAVVSTGANGSLRLQQDETLIAVSANSAIELQSNPDGGPLLQRVIQESGSAFYDIAPQGKNRFRVEAPYLVAVVKGTEFNVTATSDTSTVALFEGHLRIDAPKVGDSVEIFIGEIARRHRDDARITILSMSDGKVIERADAARSGSTDDEASDDNIVPGTIPGGGTLVDLGTGADDTTNINVDAGIELRSGTVVAGVDIGVDASKVSVDADAGVDLGGSTVDVGVDAGDVTADAGADAGLDLGSGTVDAGADVGVDAGDVTADAGVDTELDLGSGTVDAGADVGVDAEDVTADAGVDTGIDLGSGTVDTEPVADVGISVDGVSLDLGLGLSGDTDSGIVDTDLDIDGGGASDTDVDVEPAGSDDGGDLPDLGGLLGL